MGEKLGKGHRPIPYKSVEFETFVPDATTMKSIQPRVTAWVYVDPTFNQTMINKTLDSIKWRIKRKVKVLAEMDPVFKELCIVDIAMGDIKHKGKRNDKYFIKFDVALFLNPVKYDRMFMINTGEIFSQMVLDVLEDFPEITIKTRQKHKSINV